MAKKLSRGEQLAAILNKLQQLDGHLRKATEVYWKLDQSVQNEISAQVSSQEKLRVFRTNLEEFHKRLLNEMELLKIDIRSLDPKPELLSLLKDVLGVIKPDAKTSFLELGDKYMKLDERIEATLKELLKEFGG